MKKTVIYTGGTEGFEATYSVLNKIAEVLHVEASEHVLSHELKQADAFLDASMKVSITNEMLKDARKLKIISCATTGSNHISKEAASNLNIEIRTLREDPQLLLNITPAAELSWALLMACARKLKGAFSHVIEGNWTREEFPGVMLKGKCLGLIGCGRIGGWMSRYGHAFSMDVIGYDPFLENFPDSIKSVSIDELLKSSDFISIHVHLYEATENLLSEELLEKCKLGMILINTSRGQIISETGLLKGLLSGRIGGAGLDVLNGEPNIANHPLVEYAKEHDNLLITPHCGGNSPDAVRLVCTRAAEKIKIKLLES